MKALNPDRSLLMPWLSLPIVMAAYLFFWRELPERLIVHWSLSGTADASPLLSRWQSLAIGLTSLICVLGLYAWRIKRGDRQDRARMTTRYFAAAVILTLVHLSVVLVNVFGNR